MSGEDGAAAATDTGGDAGDTGVEASDLGTEAANDNDGGEAKTETPAEKRYKARLFGKEQEFTADEMRARLDDDYDWEFHGVAGKPLLDEHGQPLKRKWRDIARDVASARGAANAARLANEERKRFEQQREWGKAPENRMAFLRDVLGIEDPRAEALELAAKAFNRRKELAMMAQTDPVGHAREIELDYRKEQEELGQSRQRFQQRQQEEQRKQAWEQGRDKQMADTFKAVGVPELRSPKEIAMSTIEEWQAAGAQLPWEQLGEIVRDETNGQVLSYLDSKSDDDLLKLLGDKRRGRLRKAELAAMKGTKQAAKAEPPKPAPRTNGREKPMTAEQFMRSSRNGGRV